MKQVNYLHQHQQSDDEEICKMNDAFGKPSVQLEKKSIREEITLDFSKQKKLVQFFLGCRKRSDNIDQ